MSEPKTLFEKVWEQHVVVEPKGEPTLLYIDLQLVHEVTSPQAFEGLRLTGRKVRRPDRTRGDCGSQCAHHDRRPAEHCRSDCGQTDSGAAPELRGVRRGALRRGLAEQGVVHVVGPELGLTKPGMTIVCGDSHTSTHGAFGALAFGIGTSEVEHVLATQTLPQSKPKTFRICC